MSENNSNTLSFKDIIIIKQFIEKGLRENFFSEQENDIMMVQQQKLSNIVQEFIKNHNERQKSNIEHT